MGKKAAAAAPSPIPKEEEEEVVVEDVGEQKEGDYIFQDGSTYSGKYLKTGDDVCLHGEGVLQNGPEMFQGTFEKGQYKEGQYKSCNGAIYVGHFHDNRFHGIGEYTWNAKMANERHYRGMWKNGLMHGYGEFTNFSFGAHKFFKGFAVEGKFSSARQEQQALKQAFLDEYGGQLIQSATAAFVSLGEKTAERGGEMPSVFLVPASPAGDDETTEEKPEAAAERANIEELVSGPFPVSNAVPAAALQAFVARLAGDAEKPLSVRTVEGKDKSQFMQGRLLHEQLQYVGQAIEFEAPEAEVGSIGGAVLINVSRSFDAAVAKWKLVHIEEVQAPA